MSSHRLPRLLLALCGLLLATGAMRAGEILDAGWRKDDLFIRFSDSTAYTIDLAQSDSVQLVVHIPGAALPADVAREINLRSGNRNAVLAQAQGGELRLTVQSPRRFGYVTLWRPYSRTLVVHTFDWNGLDYAQEQYYKGLLAFEQNIDKEGLDLLQVAHATGETRAASVLGVYYARHGDLKRADQYLTHPLDADDYAARAAVQRRNGDEAGAAASQSAFDREMAKRDPNWASSAAAESRQGEPAREGTTGEARPGLRGNDGNGYAPGNDAADDGRPARMSRDRWIYIGGGSLILLGLVLIIIWLAGRGSRKAAKPSVGERITFPESKPAGGRTPAAEAKTEARPTTTETSKTEITRTAPPPDIYAAHKAKKAAMEAERRAAIPATQPTPATEATTATAPEGKTEPEEKTEPAIEETPREQPAPEPTAAETRSANPVPLQAAEIRRRIESMKAAPPQPPRPPRQEPENISEKKTIAEARRLNLSRDTVELRRRMEEANEGG